MLKKNIQFFNSFCALVTCKSGQLTLFFVVGDNLQHCQEVAVKYITERERGKIDVINQHVGEFAFERVVFE